MPSSCDILYLDYSMCQERRFQPMFRVRLDKPVPILQMYSHILRRDGTHAIESMQVTSWLDEEEDDSSEVSWSGKDIHSKLVLSERMFERFLPRYCNSAMKCCLCYTENNKSKNSFTKSKGLFVKKADKPTSRQYKCLYNQKDSVKSVRQSSYPKMEKKYKKVKHRINRDELDRKHPHFWDIRSYESSF